MSYSTNDSVWRAAGVYARAVTGLMVVAMLPSMAHAQEKTKSLDVMEFGIDVGVASSVQSIGAPPRTVPVTFRFGWMEDGRRISLEYRITANDKRLDTEETGARFMNAVFDVRLKKDAEGKIPFAGPYVSFGGGLSPLRSYISDEDAPRWRFLPSALVGIGIRQEVGSAMLRTELVTGFDRGYAKPGSALFVPSRTTVGVRFGVSGLKRWRGSLQ